MRYRLRTLLILLAVGPPLLAGAWPFVKPIVDDYYVLKYGDSNEVIERYNELIERYPFVHSGAGPISEPPGFHPVAEFLAKVLP